jgi:hypothetical protein
MGPPFRARFKISFSVNRITSSVPTTSLHGSSRRGSWAGPSIQVVAQMREWLDTLDHIEISRLPLDHGAKVALEFEVVAPDAELAMAPFREQPQYERFACGADRRELARVKHVAAENKTAISQFSAFRRVKTIRLAH